MAKSGGNSGPSSRNSTPRKTITPPPETPNNKSHNHHPGYKDANTQRKPHPLDSRSPFRHAPLADQAARHPASPIPNLATRNVRVAERRDLLHQAITNLSNTHKNLCARDGISLWQKVTLSLFGGLILGAGLIDITIAITIIGSFLSIFFLGIVCLRILACIFARNQKQENTRQHAASPNHLTDLPIYTILVPLYREANILPSLTKALMQLNYPAHRLDIKLILESNDLKTCYAAQSLPLPPQFELITVPNAHPKTKPKALNYALHFARGEYVTIYDAEDLPEPDQILKAVHVFQNAPKDLACLQAKLNFYNGNENWLTSGIMAQTPQEMNP